MPSDAALVSVTAILFWIRELTCIRQDNLAVCDSLGEITPPSVRRVHATVVVNRETVFHTFCDMHNVRPMLVLTGTWAVRVPHILTCHRLGGNMKADGRLGHDALTYLLQVHPMPWSDMLNCNLHPVRPICGPLRGSTCPLLEGCQHELNQTGGNITSS